MTAASIESRSRELGDAARDCAERMGLLASQAMLSTVSRAFNTLLAWADSSLAGGRRLAAVRDLAGLAGEQRRLAEEGRELLLQDLRNALQIASLTREELLHWQERLLHAWSRVLGRA